MSEFYSFPKKTFDLNKTLHMLYIRCNKKTNSCVWAMNAVFHLEKKADYV